MAPKTGIKMPQGVVQNNGTIKVATCFSQDSFDFIAKEMAKNPIKSFSQIVDGLIGLAKLDLEESDKHDMRYIDAFTDYPIVELGDTPNKEAPIRRIRVVAYDRDKYVTIDVEGIRKSIKAGYVYVDEGSLGTVLTVPHRELEKLPEEV